MNVYTNKFNKTLLVILVSFLVFGFTAPIAIFAASPSMVNLGTSGNFVVLSKTLITTTGTTAITGDIGVSPAAATFIQGFSLVADPSNTFSTSTYVNGKVYAANYAVPTPTYVGTAIVDMEAAYVDAAGRTPLTEPIDTRTGTLPLGTTFTTGIYKWSTDVNITGDITLSGSASDVWIFQIAGNLDISANKKVILSGGAQASNIFWAVAGTTTLEPGSIFAGNILAGPGVSTIAMQSLAALDGRALGQKDVTLIANNISITSATLNVIKHVVNDNGGTATANSWNLAVTSSNGGSGTGSASGLESGTAYTLQAGKAYGVSESGGPSGYSASLSSDCTIANAIAGATYNCTITNDDNAAHLIVIKHVINNSGGLLNASNFTTTITGVTTATPTVGGVESPGINNILTSIGNYSIDEGAHVGYTKTLSADCSGTIALGETKTCTITNDDILPGQAILEVIKKVINNGLGSAVASNFTINVAGTTNIFPSSFSGSETGVEVVLDAGSYSVTELAHTNYLESKSIDCSGSILSNQTKTCTITNTFIPTIIHVINHVINDNGGSASSSNFNMNVTGNNVSNSSFVGLENPGTQITIDAGIYSVDEGAHVGYTKTLSADCSGAIALGETKTCTITNDDIQQSSNSGSGIVYGCKDITAINYDVFVSSNPSLCKYATPTPVITPTVIVPKFPKTGFPPRGENMMWYAIISAGILVFSLSLYLVKNKKQL